MWHALSHVKLAILALLGILMLTPTSDAQILRRRARRSGYYNGYYDNGYYGNGYYGNGYYGNGYYGNGYYGNGYYGNGYYGNGYYGSSSYYPDYGYSQYQNPPTYNYNYYYNYPPPNDANPNPRPASYNAPASEPATQTLPPPETRVQSNPDRPVRTSANTAVLEVRTPMPAQIWVNGQRMSGEERMQRFVSPPLVPGRNSDYRVRARWTENGQAVTRERLVSVRPGETRTIDFDAPPQP